MLYLKDGVYEIVHSGQYTVSFPSHATCEAVGGARPVITRSDGYAPTIYIGNNGQIKDVWIGGTKSPDGTNPEGYIHHGSNVVFEGCTFWNVWDGIGEGGGVDSVYKNCRWINCGAGTLNHSVYISSDLSNALVENNIFLGGEAYHLHLWSAPGGVVLRYNFSADADYCLVLAGTSHQAYKNVWWKPSSPGYPVNLATGSGRVYRDNFHGPIASGSQRGNPPHFEWFGSDTVWPADFGPDSDNNHYMETEEYDPNPTYVALGDEDLYLGKTAAQIDAAVDALETAFTQTVQQIHDDATIETHFATIKSVIDTWKAA